MAAGLVPLLFLAAWGPTVASAKAIKSDWSKVQAVLPGTQTEVLLYKDEVPRGSRKIKGPTKRRKSFLRFGSSRHDADGSS